MSYVVGFPGADGTDEVIVCLTLDEATAQVEDLRNRRGIADVWLGRIEPIPITFTKQYRVQLGDERTPAVAAAAAVPVAATDRPQPAPVATEGQPVRPGELTEDEIDEMVALDEGAALTAEDTVIQEALARRDAAADRQSGLFGR